MGPQGSVFVGKTLDEAVRKGLEALGMGRAEVMITTLEEGSGGFLGFGARPFKVRIVPRPGGAPHEPVESGRRDGRSRDRERGGRGRRGRDDRGGRNRQGEPRRGEAVSAQEARPERGERSDRDGRSDRGGRPDRGGRGGDRPRQGQVRAEGRGEPREGRRDEPREPRAAREPREVREPRESREPREPRMEPRREERPAAPRAERPAEPPREARPEGVEGAGHDREGVRDDGGRRRRRRGRRGGRGRGSAPHESAAPLGAAPEFAEPMTHEDRSEPVSEPAAFAAITPHPQPAPAREAEAPDHRESWAAATAVREEPAVSQEQLEADARRWTEQLLTAMGFEAKVTARAEADRVDVMAEVSESEDLLTGPKGEVRQALQHLLGRMVNRGDSSRYHLQLEINDFWQRRERELEGIARGMADEAVTRGDEVVSEYLNAQERRIIHVTLREDTRVRTYALGTGMIKRIAVAPAGFEGGPQDDA